MSDGWDTLEQASGVVAAAEAERIGMRLLGGAAVNLRAGQPLPSSLRRPYEDVDVAVTKSSKGAAAELLCRLGFEPAERFNAMNAQRMVFYFGEEHLDVFVGEFRMCHAIPLQDRLLTDPVSIPLAELLLTKLQVVKANQKDLVDIAAILLTHELGENDGEQINLQRVTQLCGADWGLWRTSMRTLETFGASLDGLGLSPSEGDRVRARADRVAAALTESPKSLRWKSRARVGDRLRWYEEPEEIDHAV